MRKPPGKLIKNLANNLKRLRADRTQTDFAKTLGISQASLNRLEQGLQNVTLLTIELLCQKLNCSVSKLLD